jgi:hypothetical protein
MYCCGKYDLGSFSETMESLHTRIDKSQLARLQGLTAATRSQFGASISQARVPARLIVDFDPWALSLDITATAISAGSLRAEIDLSRLPHDTGSLLSPGDLYRIQFHTESLPGPAPFVLPLIAARLENKDINGTTLRFKLLLDQATEREFQNFLRHMDQP